MINRIDNKIKKDNLNKLKMMLMRIEKQIESHKIWKD